MSNPIALTDEERESLLTQTKQWAVIATRSPKGMPHVVPVGFIFREGRLYIDSPKDTMKVRNVTETGVAAVTVDDGEDYAELRGVMFQGDAEVLEDPDLRETLLERMSKKYFETGKIPEYAMQANEDVDRVTILVDPSHTTSWDFRKAFSDRP
jgi:PPOX class probable F420-dependent enzyme